MTRTALRSSADDAAIDNHLITLLMTIGCVR